MRMIVRALMLIVPLLLACGCGGEGAGDKPRDAARKHVHIAPHGGTLIEVGDHFAHLEIRIDGEGKMTAWVLDGEAKQPIRVGQTTVEIIIRGDTDMPEVVIPHTITLKAVPNLLTGETAGDSSQFESIAGAFAGTSYFTGEIHSLEIKGKKFSKITFEYPQGNEQKTEETSIDNLFRDPDYKPLGDDNVY